MKMTHVSAKWVALSALVATMMVPGAAWADRSTSLQGNRLIEDADDVFAFPHLATRYQDRITFDFGTSAAQGNALFLMDSGMFVWGVALHRGGLFDASSLDRNEPASLPGLSLPALDGYAPGAPAPLTIADVLFGFGDLGLRLSLGTGYDETTPPMGGATGESTSYVNAAFSFGGVEGWDLGLHLGYVGSDITVNGDSTADATQFRSGLLARGFLPMSETVSLGLLARAGFIGQGTDTNVGMSTVNSSASEFEVALAAGPRIELSDRASIAGYASLGFMTESVDPNTNVNNDSFSAQSVLLPGANLAMEIHLTSWLRARAGASYEHALVMSSQLSGAGETNNSQNVAGFNWNAGIGIVYKSFRFDGTFSPTFLTEGPDFIGGNAPLFAIVSASYLFGDAALEPVIAPSVETRTTTAPARVAPRPEPVSPDPITEPAPDYDGSPSY